MLWFGLKGLLPLWMIGVQLPVLKLMFNDYSINYP